MHVITNKSDYYYKYDIEKNRIHFIGNFQDLLLEIFQMLEKGRHYSYSKEHYGSRLNVTGKDVYCEFIGILDTYRLITKTYRSIEIHTRPYLFLDGYGRHIDTRNFLDEAIKKYASASMLTKKWADYHERRYGYHEKKYGKLHYSYRQSPVPMLSSRRGKPNSLRKRRGVRRIQQMAADLEYGKYIRKKAIPGDIWCDEIFEETRRHSSWKKQKKRKQWM